MICVICKKQADPKDDATTINAIGNCRTCQRVLSPPKPWKRRERDGTYTYGCYFPTTDLNVSERAGLGTGEPMNVTWL